MTLSTQSALAKDLRNHSNDMQHRHFATVAAIIAAMREAGFTNRTQTDVAEYFAMNLASSNPRFDRLRFLRACGTHN